MQTKGVDISEHNGAVDFAALTQAGVKFAILRLGYGSDYTSQDDAQFAQNVRKAEAAGMPWGAYLYSYAKDASMAQSEARHALRLLQGRKPLYGVWYDVEDSQIAGADLVATCQTFCAAMEAAGLYAGIYASLSWLTTKLNSPQLDPYDKWVAQWNSQLDYQGPVGLWQFTDRLMLNGKAFDGNWAYKDYPSTVKAMTGEKTPEKEEDDMTAEEVKKIALEAIQEYVAAQAKKDTPEWVKSAVEEIKAAKVMNGDDTGAFRPESTVKRDELAQTIVNYTNSELLADRVEEIVEDVLENRE